MRIISKHEFSVNFGFNLINLFSFEDREDLVVTIQPEGMDVIPVIGCDIDGKVHLSNSDETPVFTISRIHISQIIALSRRLEEYYESFEENEQRKKDKAEDERAEREDAHDRLRYPHMYSDGNKEHFDGYSSNEHYNDDLDMDQQSQEFWDNL